MNNDIYMVVRREEDGKVVEFRVFGRELAETIDQTIRFTTMKILAIVRLSNN